MADISRLTRILNGVVRGVDISSNTLVLQSIKLDTTELTKTILDKLILINTAADADGTFDTRYYTQSLTYTKTEVDNLLAAQDDASEITYTPTTLSDWSGSADPGDVVDALDQLASRLTTDEGNLSTHISDTSNPHSVTKAQVLSGDLIVNADVDASAAIALSKLAALTANRALYSDASGIIQVSSVTDTELGYLSGVTSGIQAQLNAIGGVYNRRPKAISYITDNTAAPPTEVSGDRYVLSHDGGSPHADWDGASVGDIVEFNGTTWDATTPVEGWVLYVDADDKDYLFIDDGTGQWEARATQSTSLTDGKIWIGNVSDEAAEQTVSGDISISNTGVVAITSGAIVNDDVNASAAIVESKLSLDYGTSTLNTAITNHTSDTNNPHSVTKAQVLSGDLIVNADVDASAAIVTSKLADATELAEAVTFFGSTDISAAEAETLTDGSNADSLHTHGDVIVAMVAGEALSANTTYAVRMAITGETAGRVYKADIDASASDKFYAVGLVTPTSAISAGDTIYVTVIGTHSLGSSDTNFEAGEVGQAVHIKAAGAWDVVSQITYSVDEASYRIGIAYDTSTVMLNGAQLLGIN